MSVLKVKVISLPYIFQALYVLCFTRLRYPLSVYRAIGPLVHPCLPFLFSFGNGDFFSLIVQELQLPCQTGLITSFGMKMVDLLDIITSNFFIHNLTMRRRAAENSSFIMNQKFKERHFTISYLKEKIQNGDNTIGKKILYFGSSLRGTSQYWAQRGREFRALIQYQINEGKGFPSFLKTGSCAEFYFKPCPNFCKSM